MASPTLDLLCCVFREGTNYTSKPKSHLHSNPHPNQKQMLTLGYVFFTSLFLSALVSIVGTTITLVPKRGTPRTRREAVSDDRQRSILSWLAAADLAACVGILVFAFYCMLEMQEYVQGDDKPEGSDTEWAFCVFFTAWVQFFYLSTYFWTLFYALDVYLMLRGVKRRFLFPLYFVLSWSLSAVIIVVSLVSLIDNEGDRKGMHCKTKMREVSMYSGFVWGSYIALLLVFIAMPVLYYLSSRLIKPMLQRTGVYTNRERKVKAQIQKKFMRIVIVFIVCWMPNVLNGVVQIYLVTAPEDIQWWNVSSFIPVWLLMSLLNPMQAFLNALVYWGPAGCTKVQSDGPASPGHLYHETDDGIFPGPMSAPTSLNATTLNGERTPLLRSVRL